MVRPTTNDPSLCEELRQALADLEANKNPAPAAAHPEDVNSLVPQPSKVGDASSDVATEIERIRAELRRNGCED
ncbi:MAG: hypothetical protein R3C39_13025 [Dehalococcoidia bacterium]